VLLAENAEEYELEVLGPDDEVKRTVTGADQPYLHLHRRNAGRRRRECCPASALVACQISVQVGRGFAGRLTFPDAPQPRPSAQNLEGKPEQPEARGYRKAVAGVPSVCGL
jgi:hypothetical protein